MQFLILFPDASCNEYGSAIETLVTAISLIKQSKVANDDRCKILISSLQVTYLNNIIHPEIHCHYRVQYQYIS